MPRSSMRIPGEAAEQLAGSPTFSDDVPQLDSFQGP